MLNFIGTMFEVTLFYIIAPIIYVAFIYIFSKSFVGLVKSIL